MVHLQALHLELFLEGNSEFASCDFAENRRCRDQRGNHDTTRNSTGRTYFHARRRLLRESFGQFDEEAPVARVLDFSKGNDKPQPFDDI
jgi:hypothetical protein